MSLISCQPQRSSGTIDLQKIVDEEWAFRTQEDPLLATSVGIHKYDNRLPDMSEAAIARRNQFNHGLLESLKAIDKKQLDQEAQINYDLFQYQLEDQIAAYEGKGYLIPILVDEGFHINFARLPYQVPLNTVKDYENYLRRLEASGTYIDAHIRLMQEGVKIGMTLPRVVLEGYDRTITAHVVGQPDSSVFFIPFRSLPTTFPEAERNRLTQQAKAVIMRTVVPAYDRFAKFMAQTYLPKARTSIGASELPNGKQYYNQRVKYFTTLNLTSAEIHQLGLKEVARIRADMQHIIDTLHFKGDFAAFLHYLRTSPQFYAQTPEQLLKEASFIAKKMDGKLPGLFRKLPRQPYGVEPVPADIAPKYTGGRYVPSPLDSKQPGFYWVNTYALSSRPLYILESLTLHEAVPGHHLQGALAQELDSLPNFRQYSYISAYGEGWGLYSEWLGKEAGFYTNPYSDFGRLTYEMWRACRLVVDTGIHSMGWTRQQAMDYLAGNTALSLHEVRTETDRYIAWPGQALSYKIGELKIRELRRITEQKLGEKFDVRAFHDEVLAHGAVTLPVLEQLIQDYVARQVAK